MTTTPTRTYAETYEGLLLAQKSNAPTVEIETDMGPITATPTEALEYFAEIAPGEGFTLISINLDA